MKEINSSEIKKCIKIASIVASISKCKRSQRGVAIFSKSGLNISSAHNGPVGKLCDPCKRKDLKSGVDLELCINHAERIAISNLKRAYHLLNEVPGSILYHVKLDGDSITEDPGIPYCVGCAEAILNFGIEEVVLCGREISYKYEAKEFYELSKQNIKLNYQKIENE